MKKQLEYVEKTFSSPLGGTNIGPASNKVTHVTKKEEVASSVESYFTKDEPTHAIFKRFKIMGSMNKGSMNMKDNFNRLVDLYFDYLKLEASDTDEIDKINSIKKSVLENVIELDIFLNSAKVEGKNFNAALAGLLVSSLDGQ